MSFNNIKDIEISTPAGFKGFTGIQKHTVPRHMKISFTDGTSLGCTPGHLLKFPNNEYLEAVHLCKGDVLYSGHMISNIEVIEGDIDVYDVQNVADVEEYYTNGIVSHNCAFIENVDTIWTSAQQTLSTGGKAIILSTPNGTGNFFHKTWVAAEEKQKGNRFHTIRLPWQVHPDHDQKWRDLQDELLGDPKAAAQECDCDFLTSGNTVLEGTLLKWYEDTHKTIPKEKRYIDSNLWIFEYVEYTKNYIISVDVSRGDASDFSAFHVIEVESLAQVAEYKGQIGTTELGHLLVAIATEYNNALLVIENANIGWAVIQTVISRNYLNLYYSPKENVTNVDISQQLAKNIDLRDLSNMVAGFTTSGKTRPLLIAKLVTYLNERSPVIYSQRTIDELKVFIWNNGKAEAMRGYNDDLVMSLAIGLFIRDTALQLQQRGISLSRTALDYMHSSKGAYSSNGSYGKENTGWMQKVGRNEMEDLSQWI